MRDSTVMGPYYGAHIAIYMDTVLTLSVGSCEGRLKTRKKTTCTYPSSHVAKGLHHIVRLQMRKERYLVPEFTRSHV